MAGEDRVKLGPIKTTTPESGGYVISFKGKPANGEKVMLVVGDKTMMLSSGKYTSNDFAGLLDLIGAQNQWGKPLTVYVGFGKGKNIKDYSFSRGAKITCPAEPYQGSLNIKALMSATKGKWKYLAASPLLHVKPVGKYYLLVSSKKIYCGPAGLNCSTFVVAGKKKEFDLSKQFGGDIAKKLGGKLAKDWMDEDEAIAFFKGEGKSGEYHICSMNHQGYVINGTAYHYSRSKGGGVVENVESFIKGNKKPLWAYKA